MKKSEFFNIGLPKWPALVVVGKPVTPEQAMEILIRTDRLYFSSNDREFDKQLNEIMYDIEIGDAGFESEHLAICKKLGVDNSEPGYFVKIFEYQNQYRKAVNQISLQYLNNEMIVSSWIGGPHGWCNWNGNINCRNYNIGKYPSIEEVYNEWTKIAKAFPFLELTCQLMSHEAGSAEGDDDPVIEFIVEEGKVKMKLPTSAISTTSFGTTDMFARFNNPFAERGCSIDLFTKALNHTRETVNKK